MSAKADVQAAKLMREAADIMDAKSAMQIRQLETIKMVGENSKLIFIPDSSEESALLRK